MLSFPIPRSLVSSLSCIRLFKQYSEYDPPGNYDGEYAYVLFLFSAGDSLTVELAKTFRSKACGDHLAQYSRLLSIEEIIRSYSRESSSSREQCSPLFPSPLSVMTRTAHLVSFVFVFLLTVRHMCPFNLSSFSVATILLLKSLDRRAGSLHNQLLRKSKVIVVQAIEYFLSNACSISYQLHVKNKSNIHCGLSFFLGGFNRPR